MAGWSAARTSRKIEIHSGSTACPLFRIQILRPLTLSLKPAHPMIRKYSATLHGHRTSFSLEEAFFSELKRIADGRGLSLAALIAEVDDARTGGNLSSALRLHVLEDLKSSRAQG